ncbi:hypothetical protein C5472_00275 [Photorhabdus sp. RW14-46]|uniref:hypothetical protein n=1 Tax=Photorhabdus sp. RW14-46 TaxID=2100168 RepID=UPI001E029E12|nr:hypothetical protein [Photorhabdus sp. RW14-46]
MASQNTIAEFKVTPSYALNITPQKKVTFTTKSEDFEGNLWEIYPKKGSITDVSYKEEGDFSVYTRLCYAPGDSLPCHRDASLNQ